LRRHRELGYDITFWLENLLSNNEFRVTFDGITLLDLIGKGDLPGREHYRQFTVVGRATDSLTTLEFAGANTGEFTYLDDISVTPSASVPDRAATAMLLGISGASLLLARMRFRRTVMHRSLVVGNTNQLITND